MLAWYRTRLTGAVLFYEYDIKKDISHFGAYHSLLYSEASDDSGLGTYLFIAVGYGAHSGRYICYSPWLWI